MPGTLRVLVLLATVTGLVACPAARRPEPTEPVPTAPARPARDYTNARVYQVVPEESLIRILVYRGGTLASAGHNHVIASRNLNGKVYVHEQIARSGFELVMPVALVEVDPPELRSDEGSEFPPDVPESAKQGTRKNLLSEALLDAERYPGVTISATGVEGTRESLQVTALVGIRDQQHEISVPVAVQYQEDRLRASGEFKVRQTELGLKPFSALMGALQVQDELKVKFDVTAKRSSGLDK